MLQMFKSLFIEIPRVYDVCQERIFGTSFQVEDNDDSFGGRARVALSTLRGSFRSACPDSDSSSLGVWGCQSVPHLTAVVEVKCSDWDRMADRAVKRNVRRQIKQIPGLH